MSGKVIPVKVAVRSRPLVPHEVRDGCATCLEFIPGEPQVILGTNKAFTFDYVFSQNTAQCDVYEKAARGLVDAIFKGYNATVLAYGQTGSGKTYTMGGGYDLDDTASDDMLGIIPRVIRDLYEGFTERTDYSFTAKVSYIELYKEDLFDLLVPLSKRDKDTIQVREDLNGGIRLVGLQEVEVGNADEMMRCLERGAAGRTTGATAMNSSSSRSHAIFTIHIERTSKSDSNDYFKAKFHLVDLAGSERQKKTRAEGERLKEGININKGLLALGNVISALGDEGSKRLHIPYRDSKLTRLLQDSLGGNSHTLMIACVSPADSNMEETLSTLRYADRARKIKNKPIVNRDPQAAEIIRLRQMVQQLTEELKKVGDGRSSLNSSSSTVNEQENVDELKEKLRKLQDENVLVTLKLTMAVNQNAELHEKLLQAEEARDSLLEKLEELKHKNSLHISMLQQSIQCDRDASLNDAIEDQRKHLEDMQTTINELESHFKPAEDENEAEEQQSNSTLFGEEQRAQTMKQVRNMEQLGELEKQIKTKETVIKQLMQGELMMKQYEEERKKFEDEIDKLQKERTELLTKVHEAKSNPAAAKISEQRRKRLQDVETELNQVKRKLLEQTKMLKIKEQDEKRYQKINAEIKELKQARVRMIKQIKEDAKNFTKWKQEKEKELLQLKAKDRKQQIQMVKIKEESARQQAVLKRKAQEAEAANKRLKEAMAKQKAAMEERMNRLDRHDQPFKDRVKKWLVGDLELAVSLEEARHHMNQLIQDRKDLSQQLSQLRERLGTPSFKKKRLNNHSVETCDHEVITKEIKEVERELETRNAQIADIQQKLMDADQDEKTRTRWHGLHTLVEAKVVMNQLFSTAVSAKVALRLKGGELTEAGQRVEDANKAVEEARDEADRKVKEMREEVDSLTQYYNQKILALLSELNTKNPQSPDKVDAALKKRLQLQEVEIQRLSNLAEELEKKSTECDELQKELTTLKNQMKTGLLSKANPSLVTSFFTPPHVPKRRSRKRKSSAALEDLPVSDEENVDDDSMKDMDPDWQQGYTPNPAAIKKKSVNHNMFSTSANTSDSKPSTSAETPVQCACKGNCSTKKCRCKTKNASCGDTCRCSSKCSNKEVQQPESTTDDSLLNTKEERSSVGANTTFILDGSDQTESPSLADSTFTKEPAPSRTFPRSRGSRTALRDVFNSEDLDTSADFDMKQKELKQDATLLENSGIMKISTRTTTKKGSYFGKL